MNKNREKALEGLTRIAQVIVSDKYHDESLRVQFYLWLYIHILNLYSLYFPI
jgi:hypothetical protein